VTKIVAHGVVGGLKDVRLGGGTGGISRVRAEFLASAPWFDHRLGVHYV
jgi:hypothetical protein